MSYRLSSHMAREKERNRVAPEKCRYKALLSFCGLLEVIGAGWFKAFGAWIAGMLRGLEQCCGSLHREITDLPRKPASKGKTGSENVSIDLTPQSLQRHDWALHTCVVES